MNRVRSSLIPCLGMMFFWSYFRYQSYFSSLYPPDGYDGLADIVLMRFTFPTLAVVAAFVVLAFSNRIEHLLDARRLAVPVLCALGSAGTFLLIVHGENIVYGPLWWLASCAVMVAFCVDLVAWAVYCSRMFSGVTVIMMTAAFLLSLIIFPSLSRVETMDIIMKTAVPLASGALWYFSRRTEPTEEASKVASLRAIGLAIVLFITFQLVGSVIRGIVDYQAEGSPSDLRWAISIVVTLLLFLFVWWQMSEKGPHAKTSYSVDERVVRISLYGWIVLALLFFAGVFLGMASGTYAVAGHIVVVARSTLELLLWLLLCCRVHQGRLSIVATFAVYYLLVDAVSWLLSYAIMPQVIDLEMASGFPESNLVVFVIAFSLIAVVILVFGMMTLRQGAGVVTADARDAAGQPSTTSQPSDAGQPSDAVATDALAQGLLASRFSCPSQKADQFHLTAREVEVLNLYAQGYSLRKTAEMLYISLSTAQTHLKSIYRKLGICNKDELIALLGSWQ